MITVILWLMISVVFYAIGEYCSKIWALHPTTSKALVFLLVSTLSTIAWLPAIYKGQVISIVGTLWIVMSLAATLFVGIILFHEALTLTQIIGLLFALAAIILLSI